MLASRHLRLSHVRLSQSSLGNKMAIATFIFSVLALAWSFHETTAFADLNSGVHTSSGEQIKRHDHDFSVPQMLCSAYRRPKVAVCLHGAARSFVNKLVHQSIAENLINALGVDVTTFVNMKLAGAHGNATREQVQAAAFAVGATPGNVRLLDEVNTQLPACEDLRTSISKRHLAASEALSLAGQTDGRKGCLDLIQHEENSSAVAFEFIIMMRGDLTVYAPFKPYCMYNFGMLRRRRDYFILGPRDTIANGVSKLHDLFFGCKALLGGEMGSEDYFYAYFPGFQHDQQLPLMLTRVSKSAGDPCSNPNLFVNSGAMAGDPTGRQLCTDMTALNQFNSVS